MEDNASYKLKRKKNAEVTKHAHLLVGVVVVGGTLS